MIVSAGTDTYGRVKTVSGTPIVTKFAMVQFLPLYPLKSFYFLGTGAVETTGIPILASTTTSEIHGIPLASVDWTSALMAYVRSIFAAMALFGCMAMVPVYMSLTGEHLNDFAMTATRCLLVALVIGIIGGTLTYLIPLTSRREKAIRRYSAEILGISADPARVSPDISDMWLDHFSHETETDGNPREQLIRELITTRARLARDRDSVDLEMTTDRLLDELNHADRAEAWGRTGVSREA